MCVLSNAIEVLFATLAAHGVSDPLWYAVAAALNNIAKDKGWSSQSSQSYLLVVSREYIKPKDVKDLWRAVTSAITEGVLPQHSRAADAVAELMRRLNLRL